MSYWETKGQSDEWYTPAYIFDALGAVFDLDVAAPTGGAPHVPARRHIASASLSAEWLGFVWMNPPFGGRNGLVPWLDKFFSHGNGIALVPDRTSAPWWQDAVRKSDATMFIDGKIRFLRPDGSEGKSPSNGTVLFAVGAKATGALKLAERNHLGIVLARLEPA